MRSHVRMQQRNLRLKVGVVVSSAALFLSGAALLPLGAGASGSSGGTGSGAISSDPLNTAATQIQAVAARSYSAIFGGIVETNNSSHFNIYLTAFDPSAEQTFNQLAPAGSITYLKTSHSFDSLLALQQQVLHDESSLALQDAVVHESYPDVQSGVLAIGVVGLNASSTAVLQNQFGASNIELFNMSSDPVTLTSSRTYDTSPWKGGDSITDGTTEGCTSGAPVNLGSKSYTVEASHCYSPSASIYNELNTGVGSGTNMGSGYSQDLSNGGTDTGILTPRWRQR